MCYTYCNGKYGGSMKEKILLIDGSSLIFRAFFAIRNLTTKDGISTNGVYGFLNMYRKALEIINPDYICVAFDKSGPTFRNKDYEEYKANREKTPPELSHQFGILKDVLDSMNVKHIDMNEYEADDILGTISRIANNQGIESYMLTGDRDYFQLVDANSKVLYTKKGISELEIFDVEKILEKYEVSPEDLIEIKGLMGDKSDNIPGVPGIGEKTAIKLIKEYKNIEGIYENLENIAGKKLRQNLEENEVQAYLSRKLGKIYTSVPLEYELKDFRRVEPNKSELYEKFRRLEFNTFMKEYSNDDEQIHFEQVDMNIAVDDDDIENVVKEIKEDGIFYWNILIDGENYIENRGEFLGLKGKSNSIFLINLRTDSEKTSKIKVLFENPKIKKIGFDVKKSMYLLEKFNIRIEENYEDLMLAQYLLDPSRGNYTIEELSRIYLEKEIKSEEEYLGKGKSRKNYQDISDQVNEILSGQLKTIEDTFLILLEKIEEIEMHDLYNFIEIPLIRVLADMESTGFLVRVQELERQDKIISAKVDELEKKIYELAEIEFNINSPKQLGEILFEKLGLPSIKKTKTGYSTDAEVLEKLKKSHEIVEFILEYRGLKKLKSTYIDGLYPYIRDDGRIRSIFRQTVTATGRISSIEPNLQNIPIRTEEGRLIRKAFVSSKDHLLLAADYSQIELRVLAALSMEKNMLEAFEKGIDIHRKTASEVFHVEVDEVTNRQRSEAKAVNFGIVYGISDYGLSRDLDIPRKIAKEYIDKYLESYPNIHEYMNNIVIDAKAQGFVETIFHRRRYIPELNSKNFTIRSFGERIALNTPIQGSAADIIKVAMVKVYDRLKKEKMKSKLILQIHDELVIEVHKDEVEQVKKLLKEEMETAVKLPVNLIVDMDIGDSWYEV